MVNVAGYSISAVSAILMDNDKTPTTTMTKGRKNI